MANIQGVLVVPRKKLFDDRGGIFHMLRKDDPEFQKGDYTIKWLEEWLAKQG